MFSQLAERPRLARLAHRKLDHAVLDTYGQPRELGDEEQLARLLVLNLERASLQGSSPSQGASVGISQAN